ncbi:DNA mismatch repair endonuclease MutL [Sodalis endosymbiont of Henestaris halophilus]|uniref:DNA mismatch repair endonuclease MutL n=1 Tax=Sodalis endosymbiont of Henestaris halophilus TaxID=1929246 RepID=UPI000BC058B3|nr:DNA mismatch repair endonuclease MutL [Sodalis endosymbiont of Henestaris halophilus]SNC58887.1 DNA mismatch repair protein MutL [Sodalis endosymbiont of Henestaris halophilus]
MRIQVLPPQIANQIAAGEVVERPAAVVKELIENSIDAGATHIEIDVERGGTKRIQVRDNGSGIAKQELALALARHATSKIASLNDLESITSMGFRGEALASISAVSRLILTSRIDTQSEAWQAYTEGSELAVMLKPAAHPVGTTVEVFNLFYNTPARRKFMRTEKTEFNHIYEVLRRIGLARFDVAFILRHNGKIVRQYRTASKQSQNLHRLESVCGLAFVKHARSVLWKHGDLAIHGWLADPIKQNLPDMQYSYVNRRAIRDKLINCAIRQAYQEVLGVKQHPVFVLFLEVELHQVDVNVHPTKQEVRFHQARLVHDFIYQAAVTVLQQIVATCRTIGLDNTKPRILENRQAAGRNCFSLPATSDEISTLCVAQQIEGSTVSKNSPGQPLPPPSFGKVLTLLAPYYALIESSSSLSILSLPVAKRYLTEHQLTPRTDQLHSQPLLIPLRMILSNEEIEALKYHQLMLQKIGILLHADLNQAILNAVPLPLRQQNLRKLIPELLRYLYDKTSVMHNQIASWFANRLQYEVVGWSHARVIQLLAEVERICPQWVKSPPEKLLLALNIEDAIKTLNNE